MVIHVLPDYAEARIPENFRNGIMEAHEMLEGIPDQMSDMDLLILAGGKSRRMNGIHKGELAGAGGTFTEELAAGMQPVFRHVYLSFAEEWHQVPAGLTVVEDHFPGCGPMAGIEAGLLASTTEWMAVAGCDMPLLEPLLYEYLAKALSAALQEKKDILCGQISLSEKKEHYICGVVPVLQGKMHPLAGIYHKSFGGILTRELQAGHYRLGRTLMEYHVLQVPVDEIEGFAEMLTNVNTPEEYEELRRKRGWKYECK